MEEMATPAALPATTRRPAAMARRILSRPWLIPLLFWAAGMLAAHAPMLTTGLARIQATIDTPLINYILEHGYRWLLGWPGHDRFWDPPIFYPARNTAAYTEVLLGVAPLYWGWRAVGLAPDTALQLWMLTASSLNFLAAYLLLRRGVRAGPLPSSLGAYLFSFAAIRVYKIGRSQLLPQFYTLAAVCALIRIFEEGEGKGEGDTRWIAVFFGSVVAQFYAGFYWGWFLAFALAVALAWALVLPRPRRRLLSIVRRHPGTILLSTLAGALLLAPLAVHYLQAAEAVGYRRFAEIATALPRPASWLYLGRSSWVYGGLMDAGMFRALPHPFVHIMGFGVVTPAVALWGLWQGRGRPLPRLLLLVSLTLVVWTTILPSGATLWRLAYEVVPGAKAIRAVTRVAFLLLLPASVGLALAAERLKRRGWWVVAIVALACVAEQKVDTGSVEKDALRRRVARLAAAVPPGCRAFFYSPLAGPGAAADGPAADQLVAMWVQLETAVPTLNGYLGNTPPGWPPLDWNVLASRADEVRLERALSRWIATHRLERVCWLRADRMGPATARWWP